MKESTITMLRAWANLPGEGGQLAKAVLDLELPRKGHSDAGKKGAARRWNYAKANGLANGPAIDDRLAKPSLANGPGISPASGAPNGRAIA